MKFKIYNPTKDIHIHTNKVRKKEALQLSMQAYQLGDKKRIIRQGQTTTGER